MSEARFSVDGVLDALAAQPRRTPGDGRAIMLVSARRGEGVTTAACAVAQGFSAMSVYGVDLDLRRNGLARALAALAPLGPKIDGRLNGVSFYGLRNAQGAAIREEEPAFSYHRVGHTRMFAGVFDARGLAKGVRVAVSSGVEYWNAARAGGACVVVDAPAFERSQIALRVARHMDGVVLVVADDPGAAPAALAAKAALVAAGANIIGLIYSGASAPVMAMERLRRQAG